MAPQPHSNGNLLSSEDHGVQKRGEDLALSPWTIVAIIIALLVVMSTIAFTALYIMRRRRVIKESQGLPAISGRHEVMRRRKGMTAAERRAAEETERSLMIRKSLASRSTLHSVASRDTHILDTARSSRVVDDDGDEHQHDDEIPELPTSTGDWKEWEAHTQAERRHSRLRELSAGRESHPAFAQELEDLPVPAQTRSPSPSRELKGPRQLLPLPSLPSSAPPSHAL
ncbi:hypothetical protein PFICI_00056 [Pestalotiopsis fici W106-1]|uniref:Uncharacterized protein n=1 Tax=Pestalotiopsis fici (strain W106-1 / CGMCC3.15140) TaxID=1229662 RepID=W3XJN7_PESFW|nr:uncharacterized protein PFICI_00056 [Pestalotiopsis fici W106-1]ETS86228.1 hypothetical protein PFICI_00056 [Pestalotiopsis fici W106-1]